MIKMDYNIKYIREKAHAENEINKVLNALIPEVNLIFKSYLGKKVIKTDGDLIKDLKEQFNNIDYNQIELKPLNKGNVEISSCYIANSTRGFGSYSMTLKVKLCFCGGSYEDKTYYCFYHNKTYYFGELKEQILTKIEDFKPFEEINTDLEIITFKNCQVLRDQLEKEQNKFKIYEFRNLK